MNERIKYDKTVCCKITRKGNNTTGNLGRISRERFIRPFTNRKIQQNPTNTIEKWDNICYNIKCGVTTLAGFSITKSDIRNKPIYLLVKFLG